MGRSKAKAKRKGSAAAAATSAASAQKAVELKAGELYERLRDSETLEKAQAKSAELAEKLRDAHLDERAAELADRALSAVREAHLDERAAAVAARVRDSEAAQRAAEAARRRTDDALDRFGDWISTSKAGERLGIAPKKRRRLPMVLAMAIGTGIGYVIAKLTSQGTEPAPSSDLFVESAERLAASPPSSTSPTWPTTSGEQATPPSSLGGAASDTGATALTEEIRSSLDADPRTTGLHDLAINVAESTVFVRGSVPAGFDESSIREVVARVPGVTDVDLQVTFA